VDREKKIAEIREAVSRFMGAGSETEYDRALSVLSDYAGTWIPFLLSELDRAEKELELFDQRGETIERQLNIIEQLQEENRKLLEARDEARRKAEEAWKEIDSLEEQLLSAQQDRDKLIEGLRWYAYDIKYMNWPSELWINQGQRARDILKEMGVTDV